AARPTPSGTAEGGGNRADRQLVAVGTEGGDRAGGDGGERAGAPPGLAGVGVGEVQLDHRAVKRGERVVQAPGVVGERAGVDDDGVAAAACGMDPLDQLALVVRL